jgi:hypothetical protein
MNYLRRADLAKFADASVAVSAQGPVKPPEEVPKDIIVVLAEG